METTMTDTDKVIQVAASRIQGLTRQVNHWKDRTEELEAALGIEKAARISAEATRDRALDAGAANVELQEELRKERSAHEETNLYLSDAQAKVRELHSERDGLFARLRQSIARGDFAGIVLAEAHAAIWGLGCEITNLRCDLTTALKHERDCAKDEWDRAEERRKGLIEDIEVLRVELRESQKGAVTARQDAVTRAEADRVRFAELFNDHQRLKAELAVIKDEHNALRGKLQSTESESPRQHPVKVGEWVKRTSFDYCPNTKMGAVAKVVAFDDDGCYRVTINGAVVCWGPSFCAPCDPPETTQDTPEDKETAAGAVTPKPGDKVRLVRVPTEQDCEEYDYTDPEQRRLMERHLHTTGTVLAGKHECGCLKVQMAHSAFVKAWPQSCIEIVDAK